MPQIAHLVTAEDGAPPRIVVRDEHGATLNDQEFLPLGQADTELHFWGWHRINPWHPAQHGWSADVVSVGRYGPR